MDDPVLYQPTTAFEWTERAFELLSSGEITVRTVGSGDGVVATTLAGPCPRCGHHLLDNQVGTAVTSSRSGTKSVVPPATVEIDVSCGCGVPHPTAPEHVTGCGVGFRVQLVLEDS